MTLESTMILLDNSEYSINGDYLPNRWEGQYDATSILFESKYQMNQENSVGLMTMAGNAPKVLVSTTQEAATLRASLHAIKLRGQINFKSSIQIACLALKHRQNKLAKSRIIAFVASPLQEDEKTLVDLAKKLKKSNYSVDLINIGQMEEEHVAKLQKFVDNCFGNSHFLNIPPSQNVISNVLIGSPIIPMGVPQIDADFPQQMPNQEPNDDLRDIDPELAEAIRVSLMEDQARQQKNQEDNKMVNEDDNKKKDDENKDKMEDEDQDLDEEAMIEKARVLSLEDDKKDIKDELLQNEDFIINELIGDDLNEDEKTKLLQNQKDNKDKDEKKDK